MKQLKTLLIAAALFIGANQTISAQAKVAHIDVQELMTTMPEMKIWLMEHGQMGLIIKIQQLRQLEIQ